MSRDERALPAPGAPFPGFARLGAPDPAAADDQQGNLVLLRREPTPAVLKVYRPRRGALRTLAAGLSHRVFEGKRGVSPRARRDTEREALALWARHGFDAPALLPDEEPPAWARRWPTLWLEHTPGERLFELLHLDPQRDPARQEELVRRLGREQAPRHRLAVELDEPLLLLEHATIKHCLVSGERLVTIDLEGGYRRGYPVLLALALELAGVLRSIWRGLAPCFEEPLPRAWLEAWLAAGGDPELLRRASRRGLEGGLSGWLRRRQDRRRRSSRPKTGVLEALLATL